MPDDRLWTAWRIAALVTALAVATGPLAAQERVEEEVFKRHRVGLLAGITWVPRGFQVETSSIFAPTIGLDYDYSFAERFAVGVYTDFQLSSYFVETNEGQDVERENAFIAAVVGVFEVVSWLEFYAGPGIELEKHANYWMVRVGTSIAPTFGGVRGGSLEVYFDAKEEYVSLGISLKVAGRF